MDFNSSKNSYFIINGTLINPTTKMHGQYDLWIDQGIIRAIDKPGSFNSHIQSNPSQVIDAKNNWVLPGFIDLHVHLREPGLEYKESIETGTRAAALGGFTSVACMANTLPVNDSPYVTAFIREKSRQVASCRVHIVGAVTKGLKGEELAEIGSMVEEGALALSDDGKPVMNSYLMRKALDYSKAFGIPIISHAEDENLVGKGVMNEGALSNQLGLRGIPAAAEEILIAREVALCRLTKAPIHIQHISSAIGLEHIRRAKEDGLPITAEVTPHHLLLDESKLCDYDTHYKMSPPLRSEKDVEALQNGLKTGLIDAIATDHAPHGVTDKAVEFAEAANGVIGLQTALPTTLDLVHKGIIGLERWIESFTTSPAKLLKLPYGSLQTGRSADLIILDPHKQWSFEPKDNVSKSSNSPFFGWKLKGKVLLTMIGGTVVHGYDS